MRIRRLVSALVAAAAMAGCAHMPDQPEAPVVGLAGIQLSEMTLFEQRYQLKLRVQNPNDFALPVDGLHCKLFVNEHEFATGVSDERVTVPRFGEAVLTVEVVSDLRRVFEQLRDSGKSKRGVVSYRLSGKVSLMGYRRSLTFDHQGEFDLQATE